MCLLGGLGGVNVLLAELPSSGFDQVCATGLLQQALSVAAEASAASSQLPTLNGRPVPRLTAEARSVAAA